MGLLEVSSFVFGLASVVMGLAGCPESWGMLSDLLSYEVVRIGLVVLGLGALGYWASRVSYLRQNTPPPPKMKIDVQGLGPEYNFILTETECTIRRVTSA
jgi:hypothetical protein